MPTANRSSDMKRRTCRYCDSELPGAFLELGSMALANSFVARAEADAPEFECPLSVTRCGHCGLVQLTHVVPPELMFTNYLYVSSTSRTFREHFAEYAKSVHRRSIKKQGLLAVDVGSNDGLLLSCFENEGMRAVGVEPATNLSTEANRNGRTTINGFFGSDAVTRDLKSRGPVDVITANNVFAHIDDSRAVCESVVEVLDPQGMFVIEFPYLATMLDDMVFDMIYHEHLSYIALTPLRHLLARSGMEIFAVERVSSHGGSLRVFIQKAGGGHPIGPEVAELLADEQARGLNAQPVYDDFARRVYQVRDGLTRFVLDARSSGKTVGGYGAAAKSNTLINFCRFGPEQIRYIVDDNPLKQNMLSPGSRIPVVPSSHLREEPVDCLIIFAWNFAREILGKLEDVRQAGMQCVVPLPSPTVL
jgi:SAM-dependent methyltransferase